MNEMLKNCTDAILITNNNKYIYYVYSKTYLIIVIDGKHHDILTS